MSSLLREAKPGSDEKSLESRQGSAVSWNKPVTNSNLGYYACGKVRTGFKSS